MNSWQTVVRRRIWRLVSAVPKRIEILSDTILAVGEIMIPSHLSVATYRRSFLIPQRHRSARNRQDLRSHRLHLASDIQHPAAHWIFRRIDASNSIVSQSKAGGTPLAKKNLPGWPTLCGFGKGGPLGALAAMTHCSPQITSTDPSLARPLARSSGTNCSTANPQDAASALPSPDSHACSAVFPAGGTPLAKNNLPGWPTLCGFGKGWAARRAGCHDPLLSANHVHGSIFSQASRP